MARRCAWHGFNEQHANDGRELPAGRGTGGRTASCRGAAWRVARPGAAAGRGGPRRPPSPTPSAPAGGHRPSEGRSRSVAAQDPCSAGVRVSYHARTSQCQGRALARSTAQHSCSRSLLPGPWTSKQMVAVQLMWATAIRGQLSMDARSKHSCEARSDCRKVRCYHLADECRARICLAT